MDESGKEIHLDIGGGPDIEVVSPPEKNPDGTKSLEEGAYEGHKDFYKRYLEGLNFTKQAKNEPNNTFIVVDPLLDDNIIQSHELPENLHFVKGIATENSSLPFADNSITGAEINRLFMPLAQRQIAERLGYSMETKNGKEANEMHEALESFIQTQEDDEELTQSYRTIIAESIRVLKSGGILTLREKSGPMKIIRKLIQPRLSDLGLVETEYIDLDLEDHGTFSAGSILEYERAKRENDTEWMDKRRPTTWVLTKAA